MRNSILTPINGISPAERDKCVNEFACHVQANSNALISFTKLFLATLFSTPLRGKKAQKIISNLLMSIIIVVLLGIGRAQGFDVDGLKNGMRKEAVIEILARRNFENVLAKGNQVQFYDLSDKENNRYSVVTFKNNKLVGYSKNLRPSISNYIKAFKSISDEYGPTVNCQSAFDAIPDGEIRNLRCSWISPIDEVSISYSVFPASEQLSVSYVAR